MPKTKKPARQQPLTDLAKTIEEYILNGGNQPDLKAIAFKVLQAAYVEVTNRHPELAHPPDITDAGLRYDLIGGALDVLSGELYTHTPPSTWNTEDGVGTGRRIGGSHLGAQIQYHGKYPD